MKKVFKSKKGITLVALIITVIVMLILAGVAISVIVDGEGLFSRTRQAAEEYEQAAKDENTQLQSLMDEIDRYLEGVPSTPGDGNEEGNEGDGGDTPTPEGPIAADVLEKMTNGSWDEEKQIHTPKVVEGMSVIYWDENGVEKELTANNTETEWNNWYNYTEQTGSTATPGSGTSKWANAVTKNDGADNIAGNEDDQITGYWVWIPRYEYKLTVPTEGAEAGTIHVNFIQIGSTTSTGYKLHPAFSNNPAAGGWDSDIPGFWVAKYPAGFQASTVLASSISETATIDTITLENGTDTVEYSNLKYTTPWIVYTNALGQVLNNPVDTTACNEIDAYMSYPVFKPLTYAYNAINIDSSFRISQQIANATEFYGLSGVDSHQMKNSEWGAVAYLTWSQYGRNATEPNINNVNLDNSTNTIYAVTGIYSNGTDTAYTAGTFTGNAYNTATGQLGSSTGNITGVYDLNGCVWERVSGYITNAAGETNRNRYGASVIAAAAKYKAIYASGDESTAVDGDDSDTTTNNEKRQINYEAYSNSETKYYGDAILEISTLGYERSSWNTDHSVFLYNGRSFLVRGGDRLVGGGAGLFAFGDMHGHADKDDSFRITLI